MRNIVITGFDYFNKYYINTSGEIASKLDGLEINGYRIHGIILPVSYKRAPKILYNVLHRLKPIMVLGLGLAPRADKVILEIAASNVAHFTIPDVEGYKAFNELIDGSRRLRVVHTTLPIDRILHICVRERGCEITLGLSIGTYLCGVIGYIIMNYALEHGIYGGFLHLPPHTDLAMRVGLQKPKPLDLIMDSVLCVVRSTIEFINNASCSRTPSS